MVHMDDAATDIAAQPRTAPRWLPIETAPKDGTWLLLEGEMAGGDTSSVKLGRWEPRAFDGRVYEWRCLDDSFAGIDQKAEPDWNWYPEGRVAQWMPLP